MIYKIFSYKKVNSTNDIAIKKIKKGFTRGLVQAGFQKKVEANVEKNGFRIKVICLFPFFLKLTKKSL